MMFGEIMAIHFEGRSAGRYRLSSSRIAFGLWVIQISMGLSIMISEIFRDFSKFLQENSGLVLPLLRQIPSNLVVTSNRAIGHYI
jgi:hypothetical protein